MDTFKDSSDESLLHSKTSDDEGHRQDENFGDEFPKRLPKKASWIRSHWKAILFHSTMTVLYCILVLLSFQDYFTVDTRPQRIVYSPASEALEWRVQDMYNRKAKPNKYMGNTDEADQAWTELMKGTNVRLTEEDMKHLDRPSVALGDGGYLGMFSVFHELHCLKMVRWSRNLERYGHNYSPKDIQELPDHIDHCLDMVRQSVMCRADTSPIPYYWTNHSRIPETDFYARHQCVNWEKLEDWLKDHTVDVYKKGMLNHPEFGASYPGGHRLIEDNKEIAILPFESVDN